MSLKMTMGTGPRSEDLLIFTKKRGKISIREIDDFFSHDLNSLHYSGLYYVPFIVKDDGYQGWELGEPILLDAAGNEVSDRVVLVSMNDGEECHFCEKTVPGSYCPHCGESIRQEDYKI